MIAYQQLSQKRKKSMTNHDIDRTPQYERQIRKRQINVIPGQNMTQIKAVQKFHEHGTISHELFCKSYYDKQAVKQHKRNLK